MNNYTVYHLHTELSNYVSIDSISKYQQYVDRAKELGMTALGFSEHASVFSFYHKKIAIENAGLKYIHGAEMYLTETLEEKIRDNYHLVMIAKNYQGFLELNKLITTSFNRDDNHFYYAPRISIEELEQTSDNILITTACLGSALNRGTDSIKTRLLNFVIKNKHRCFLEIQHHDVQAQKDYNDVLYQWHKKHNIPLIAGTDTHSLDETAARGRLKLQKGKGVSFPEEDDWDLTFKTYDELVNAYEIQACLQKEVYLKAIDNTNVLANMVEEFSLDTNNKYPKIYEQSDKVFKEKVNQSFKRHKIVHSRHDKQVMFDRIYQEFDGYEKTGAVDYMLLQNYLREWEVKNGIFCGPARGSVSGSFIAYLMGITSMDSIKFGLNFYRFINPERVSLADIDSDYGDKDRDRVKEFILRDKMDLPSLNTSEIITFNTIALKGAIRDISRAYDINLGIVDQMCNDTENESAMEKWRKRYPEVFEYVDIVQGTVVSVGSHPSGVLISDLNISETIGLCTLSGSQYPVSMLNMKELEDLHYVKLDILGLDNVAIINETCKLANIERLTPDNVNLDDEEVWQAIIDDTTGVFQFESPMARNYFIKFMSKETISRAKAIYPNFSMIKWLSFANGLLRPGCASFRDQAAEGTTYDFGLQQINDFFAPTLGYVIYQEDVMNFLSEFCGYSMGEADVIRRKIAKSSNTDELLPEIGERFINFMNENHGTDRNLAREVIKKFLQVVHDASAYMFSLNHSDSYSMIGYIGGYLRHHYPLEFITAALNIFKDKEEKTLSFSNYAAKIGIKILRPKFKYSKADYYMDKSQNAIYKGLSSIKYMSESVADELATLYKKPYISFITLLYDLKLTSINSKQIDILIKVGYFDTFGNTRELLTLWGYFDLYHKSKIIKKDSISDEVVLNIIKRFAVETEKQYRLNDNADTILYEIEDYVMSLNLEDYPTHEKAQMQYEALGYIDLSSGDPSDANKLIVTSVEQLKTKDKKRIWGYKIGTSALLSGKTSELIIMDRVFDFTPLKKYDVIITKREWLEKRESGKYTNWYMRAYNKV